MKKSVLFFFLLAIGLVCGDQFLKIWVVFQQKSLVGSGGGSIFGLGGFFNLVYVENNGVAFGFLSNLGSGFKVFLTLFRLFAAVFISLFFVSIIKKKQLCFLGCVPMSLVLAGALGNVIDSVFYGVLGLNISGESGFFQGKVIDMFSFSFFPPVFNLADAFVCVGAFCLFLFQTNLILNKKKSIWDDFLTLLRR